MNTIVLNKIIPVKKNRRLVKTKVTTYSDFINKVQHDQIKDVVIFPDTSSVKFLDSDGLVDSAKVVLNDFFFTQLNQHLVNTEIATSIPAPLEYIIPFGFLLYLLYKMPTPPPMPGNKSEFEIVKDVSTKFTDVAGIEQELLEVKEIVNFLKDPKKFTDAGAIIPKGCLLSGPPGTGKTLIARAIAGEAGVPFVATSASQFIELFVGLGAARVRNLFKTARDNAPCIIFIDELDAIAKSRSASPVGNNNDEREQTLNQILTEMDGFKENEGIIVIGATNRPEVIDPAILRPGRFDRKIVVGLPDRDSRKKILKVHSKTKKFSDDVSLSNLAATTTGFSGAELQNLLNEAAIYAARDGRVKITKYDLDNSYEKITLGLPKNKILTKETKKILAYHEAGHAVVGTVCGEKIGKITILPRGNAGGFTQFIPDEEELMLSKNTLENKIKIALGGKAAEELIFGEENVTTGAVGDLQKVTEIVYKMYSNYGFSSVGNFMIDGDSSEYLKSQVDQQVTVLGTRL
jgi:cell division protease FtsH